MDLVLSSGFLAFARHCGVLQAIEDHRWPVDAIAGTSSGALVGALWSAGWSAERIVLLLCEDHPLRFLRLHGAVWRGLFSTDGLVERLATWLPPRFSDLDRPLAVGVRDPQGRYRLVHEGELPRAVAASCSVPVLFAPTVLDGEPLQDGGAADRVGWDAWRQWRPGRSALVHRVDRSAGARDAALSGDPPLIRTPRSGATLFSLGDVRGQAEEARGIAAAILAEQDGAGA
jgi:predicted acylesterase/phospholipase RssA